MKNVPYRKRLQKYHADTLDTLFGTPEMGQAVRNELRSSTLGVSEFVGKGSGITREEGTRIIFKIDNSKVLGIVVEIAFGATDGTGFKTVEGGISPATEGSTSVGFSALGKSFTGGSGDAQLEAEYEDGEIHVLIQNNVSSNPAKVFDYSYKIKVFYK